MAAIINFNAYLHLLQAKQVEAELTARLTQMRAQQAMMVLREELAEVFSAKLEQCKCFQDLDTLDCLYERILNSDNIGLVWILGEQLKSFTPARLFVVN